MTKTQRDRIVLAIMLLIFSTLGFAFWELQGVVIACMWWTLPALIYIKRR